MYRAIRLVLLTTILVTCVGACGCPVTRVREAAARAQRMNSIKIIGLAFVSYCDDVKNKDKPPREPADLLKYAEGDPQANALLTDGSFVFIYGVTTQDMMKQKGMSQTVLGYDKAVETDKGIVLMGDGATQYVTADEFKKMTKATPAPK
jgi:hypothetical protein